MKKILAVLAIVVLAAVLVWVGLAARTKTEDLDAQLQQTVDDGGAADFVELQKSAEGL